MSYFILCVGGTNSGGTFSITRLMDKVRVPKRDTIPSVYVPEGTTIRDQTAQEEVYEFLHEGPEHGLRLPYIYIHESMWVPNLRQLTSLERELIRMYRRRMGQ